MERTRRWAVAAGLVLAAVAASCSSTGPEPGGASDTTVAPVTLPPTTVIEGGGTTTIVEAPVTFPHDADATQVVAELGPRLPMSEAEQACVVQDVAANPDLLGRLSGGVSPGTELFDEVAAVHQRCTVTVTQAPMFANSVNQQAGGALTPEQLACLTDGFAALSPEQLDAVMAAVFNPLEAADGAAVRQPLDDLAWRCGVRSPS